jgi:hypothetical protein
MCTYFSRLLFPVVLSAAVAVWAADPLLVAYPSQAPARVEDHVFGTWILNPAKSKFSPGPAPKSQKRTYEAHPEGVRATIETVHADGHTTSTQYVANYDAVEYPVTGNPNSDAIALKKINNYTAEATLSHAGRVMATARRVISSDGKTMTITYQGMWAGQPSNNVAVYEKQEP